MNQKAEGDVTDDFEEYTLAANKAMVEKTAELLVGEYPQDMLQQMINAIVTYPDRQTTCTE